MYEPSENGSRRNLTTTPPVFTHKTEIKFRISPWVWVFIFGQTLVAVATVLFLASCI